VFSGYGQLTHSSVLRPGYQKTVFLLEDDHSMCQSLTRSLEFLGYQVHAYESPSVFLNAYEPAVPAVLVSDMHMPGMSGVELQAELLRRGRSIPIIFISGESSVSQGIQAMKQGALEFLVKPFEREDLLGAIERGLALDARNMQRLLQKSALEENLKSLSPRELETFQLLIRGFSNQQIMDALDIALPTAKQY